MKKFKVVLVLLILAVVSLVIYQNWAYFATPTHLNVNYYMGEYPAPVQFTNGMLALASFLIGFLIAYFLSLANRFKSRKTIRSMKEAVDSSGAQVAALRSEIESIKGTAVVSPPPPEPAGPADEASAS